MTFECYDCDKEITRTEYEQRHRCEKCETIYQNKQKPKGIAEEASVNFKHGLECSTLVIKEVLKQVKENEELPQVLEDIKDDILAPLFNTLTDVMEDAQETHIRTRTALYIKTCRQVAEELEIRNEDAILAVNVIMAKQFG